MHNIRKIKDLDPKCGKIQTLVLYCTKIEEKRQNQIRQVTIWSFT